MKRDELSMVFLQAKLCSCIPIGLGFFSSDGFTSTTEVLRSRVLAARWKSTIKKHHVPVFLHLVFAFWYNLRHSSKMCLLVEKLFLSSFELINRRGFTARVVYDGTAACQTVYSGDKISRCSLSLSWSLKRPNSSARRLNSNSDSQTNGITCCRVYPSGWIVEMSYTRRFLVTLCPADGLLSVFQVASSSAWDKHVTTNKSGPDFGMQKLSGKMVKCSRYHSFNRTFPGDSSELVSVCLPQHVLVCCYFIIGYILVSGYLCGVMHPANTKWIVLTSYYLPTNFLTRWSCFGRESRHCAPEESECYETSRDCKEDNVTIESGSINKAGCEQYDS